jgi:hypothetical protein
MMSQAAMSAAIKAARIAAKAENLPAGADLAARRYHPSQVHDQVLMGFKCGFPAPLLINT